MRGCDRRWRIHDNPHDKAERVPFLVKLRHRMNFIETSKPRFPVNVRSLLAGLIGVILLSLAAPFSDLVLQNSALVGGALPVGATFLFCAFVVVVNGPLSRYLPRWAFQSDELAIVLSMMLVSCALPTRGLMQMWPTSLVGVWEHSLMHPEDHAVFELLKLPSWFWPGSGKRQGASDPAIAWFSGSAPLGTTTAQWLKVSEAWIGPVVGWGVFFIGVAMAVMGLSAIAAQQWIENERLTFPVSTVQLAIVQAPQPGHWFNSTFRNRAFLVGFGVVGTLRIVGGLREYFPNNIPGIPMAYDLRLLFVAPPFSYIDSWITSQTIYPFVIAMTFFIAGRISFSLWTCVILSQIPNLIMGPMQTSMGPHRSEVNLGALLSYALMILYSGRHSYAGTLKSMLTPRPVPSHGRPSYNRAAGYFALAGFIISVAWLTIVHMPVIPAILLIGSLLLIWLVMANVVARSGLLVANTLATPHEWFAYGFSNPGGLAAVNASDIRTQFFAQLVGGMWAYNTDHLSVYTTHSIEVCAESAPRARNGSLFAALALSLGVSFFASLGSTLWCQYHYASTLDETHTSPVNAEVFNGQPQWTMDHTVLTIRSGLENAHRTHSAWPWVGTAAVVTAGSAFCQLRYSAWPLHPIGLLMMYSYPMRRIWFSVFLGWFLKTVLIRLGGAKLYQRSVPLFLGIVIGEIMMAALFAILAATIWAVGGQYKVIPTLPTSQF
jgi:hypothetical protein